MAAPLTIEVGMARFIGIVVAALLTLGLTGGAWAHAALVAATPAQGSVVAAAPAALTLEFNEPVSPLVLKLVLPDGSVTALSGGSTAQTRLEIAAPAGLGTGSYLLSYRVISADGHPIGGTVGFAIGAVGGKAGVGGDAIDWPLLVPIWLAKVLVYAGLFFGVGGVFFRLWLAGGSRAGRGPGRVALVLGVIAAPLAVGLQGLDALGLSYGGALSAEVWSTGVGTTLGLSLGIAAAAMVVALLADWLGARLLALLALAGVGASLVATGHASTAEPLMLTRLAVFVHGSAIAFWAGALLPLWRLLKTNAAEAEPALRRFSNAIPVVLAALIVAGAILAVIQLGSPAALVQSAYGWVLLGKLMLVALVLVLAAINRWQLTGRSDAQSRRRLVRIIAVETGLLLAVMGLAALWRFTPPPRLIVPPMPVYAMLHAEEAMADIAFSADAAGLQAVTITLDGEEKLLGAQGLGLTLSNPNTGIEAISYAAEVVSPGVWRVAAVHIPTKGIWEAQIDLRVSDFELLTLRGEVEFP